MISIIAFAVITILVAKLFLPLSRNYLAARRTGLPFITSLIDPTNALWALTKTAIVPYLTLLPGDAGRNARLNIFGWQFRAKYGVHQRLGQTFIQVTPASNIMNIAEPGLAQQVLQRIEDFPKPRKIYERIEIFGPNLDSVNGEAWKRHRKLTAPAFNERVSSLVWEEGLRQANQLLNDIDSTPSHIVNNINDICKTIALHVLTYAGFGVQNDYSTGVTNVQSGHWLTYKDALCTVLSNMVLAIVVPVRVLASPLAPESWQKVSLALGDFRKYMEEMLEQERNTIHDGTPKSGSTRRSESLTGALIRASEEEKTASDKNTSKGLTDQEIYGNMFIFNFAGHDTTANTMAYAIALLAIHPDVQDWVREEITSVLSHTNILEYDQVFPRLKRVRALMYETLRLYPPVVYIPKLTTSQVKVPSPIKDNEQHRDIVIPPNTYVVLNLMHLHSSPEYWGDDSLLFRPNRWLEKKGPADMDGSTDDFLVHPPPGVFMPWATGPRVCPGMKFAQVEFVSVVSSLLVHHRVEAALPPTLRDRMVAKGLHAGEIANWARERLQTLVDDSDVRVTTTMLRPGEVWLRWHKAVNL